MPTIYPPRARIRARILAVVTAAVVSVQLVPSTASAASVTPPAT